MEFEMLKEAATEANIKLTDAPVVERVEHTNKSSRKISAIKWGIEPTELVLLHGGAQNAHTWDTVALALLAEGILSNLLVIDLPGHGHSDWREDHKYNPQDLAEDIADIVTELAPSAKGLVGMSLGGLTAIMLSQIVPVARLMLVDITPSINRAKAEPIIEFISGPQEFDSFEAILKYTQEFNPTRSERSLARGIKNNAKEIEDGKWTWRWDPERTSDQESGEQNKVAWGYIWEALEAVDAPLILFKGGGDSSVLGDEDVEEFLRRKPVAEVVVVGEAGHSVQGDKPVELAQLISDFISR